MYPADFFLFKRLPMRNASVGLSATSIDLNITSVDLNVTSGAKLDVRSEDLYVRPWT